MSAWTLPTLSMMVLGDAGLPCLVVGGLGSFTFPPLKSSIVTKIYTATYYEVIAPQEVMV